MRSTYIRRGHSCSRTRIIQSDCTILGPRCKLLREWTQPFHRGYGVGLHKTTTLITVSVLLLPRLPIQQVDLSWTSDICERAGNVGDVKVTDEGEILDQIAWPVMECSHPALPVDVVTVAKKIEHSVQTVIGLCSHSNAIKNVDHEAG